MAVQLLQVIGDMIIFVDLCPYYILYINIAFIDLTIISGVQFHVIIFLFIVLYTLRFVHKWKVSYK